MRAHVLAAVVVLAGCSNGDGSDPSSLPIGGFVAFNVVETETETTANVYAEFYSGFDDGLEHYEGELVHEHCWDPLAPAPEPTPAPYFPIPLDVGDSITLTSGDTTHIVDSIATGVYSASDLVAAAPGSRWTVTLAGTAEVEARSFDEALVMPSVGATILAPAGSPATLPATGPVTIEWTPMDSHSVFLALRKDAPGLPGQAPRRYCIADDDGSFEFSAEDVAAVGTAGTITVSGRMSRFVDLDGRGVELQAYLTTQKPFRK